MMQHQQQIQQKKCCCDCGTRIVIDQQLLEQRQMWKQKYLCLQRQMSKDVNQMKQTIYTECSTLMQQQFQNREKQHSKQLNKKNSEIQTLTSNIISLQTTIKVSNKQKQYDLIKFKELQDEIKEKDRLINMMKTQSLKAQNNWTQKLQDDKNKFVRKVLNQNKDNIVKLQTENQHLKHKLKDFEKKYLIIIPEVERLKNLLSQKCSSFDNLESKYEKLKRNQQQQMSDTKLEKQELENSHGKCRGQIIKLNEKIAQLQIQIKNQKKAKNQVRVQPIYIQRPVTVQKIIQKIIPVQKVIKQYIEPEQYRDQALEHEYRKLKLQNDRIVKENHIFQRKFQQTAKDYEKVISDYEANILKYKSERQSLGKKILELNKELDIVYNVRNIQNNHTHQPESVKVYVKNDGHSQYYSTGATMPKVYTATALNSPRTQRTLQRSISRNKTLSNSQSVKRVNWK